VNEFKVAAEITMYYTVYRDRIPVLEKALKELNISYYSRSKHPLIFHDKWGTHKFDKRNESKISVYLIAIGESITFQGHSIW